MKKLTENDVTPRSNLSATQKIYSKRRMFGASLSLAAYFPQFVFASTSNSLKEKLANTQTTIDLDEKINSYKDITSYNNFY